jgi:thioester reductase-like protein
MAVFVTGATGFLGRYLVGGLLDAGEDAVLLVRGDDRAHAEARAREALGWFERGYDGLVGGRVRVCVGELGEPGLGLSRADRDAVVAQCDSFLHSGASVRFDLPLERARAVNVEGTRGVLDLAAECQRRGRLRRVDHVSTCYVAGRRTDVVAEDDLDAPLGHRNSYERAKFEGEVLLREAARRLPVAVHRPSIIVGESDFGRTSSFNTLYWPVRAYASGLWRTLPGRRDTPLDIVPIDFVRDAILALRRREDTLGGTFHVAAGADAVITVGDVVSTIERFFPHRKSVRYVDPSLWLRVLSPVLRSLSFGQLRRFLRSFEAYVPYAIGNPRFDNARTAAILGEEGVEIPSVASYFERLLYYAVESDWGRRDRPKTAQGA